MSVPPTHDGETPFWLELTFNAPVAQGSKPQLQALLDVTGGVETRFRRKNGQLDHWRIRIDPSSDDAVTVMLAPSPPCGESGAVCTDDGRTFTTGLATQIHGPASGNNGSDDSARTAITPVPALPLAGIGLLGLLLAFLGSRRAVCGFLTVATLLTLPTLAQAQTTIWSSTLTVRTLETDIFGCTNFLGNNNSCSTYLSDTDFTYDRITYSFPYIAIYPPSFLRITVNRDLATATQNLTLTVDGRAFPFEDALNDPAGSPKVKTWNNAVGLSWTEGDTVSLTITDPDRRPGAPETPAAPSVGATEGKDSSLDVGWLEPALAGPFVKYYLHYRQETHVDWTEEPQNITITFANITGLSAGATYEVQVLASNSNGDSEWSPSGTGQTDSGAPPGAPTNLTATANGEDRINLSWTAPSSEGGIIPSNPGEPDNEMEDDRIRSYKIEVRSAASNWLVLDRTIGSTDTVYSHRDVPAGVIRCYRVSATNTAGTGLPSNEAVATTGEYGEGTCDRPPTPARRCSSRRRRSRRASCPCLRRTTERHRSGWNSPSTRP